MLRTPYSSGTTTRYAVPITERTRSTPYLVSCIRRSHERPAAGCARCSIIQSSERWHLAAYCPFNIPVLHTASSEVRSTGVISWCHSLSSLVSDHSCRAGSLPFWPASHAPLVVPSFPDVHGAWAQQSKRRPQLAGVVSMSGSDVILSLAGWLVRRIDPMYLLRGLVLVPT